jgi:hypothetical protein
MEIQTSSQEKMAKEQLLWSSFVENELWPKIEELRQKCEQLLEAKSSIPSNNPELFEGYDGLVQFADSIANSLAEFSDKFSRSALKRYVCGISHEVMILIVMVNHQLLAKKRKEIPISLEKYREVTSAENQAMPSKERFIQGFIKTQESEIYD